MWEPARSTSSDLGKPRGLLVFTVGSVCALGNYCLAPYAEEAENRGRFQVSSVSSRQVRLNAEEGDRPE